MCITRTVIYVPRNEEGKEREERIMSDVKALKDKELEEVSGGKERGIRAKKVSDVVNGRLYQSTINSNHYAKVVVFSGYNTATVHFRVGWMESDGKVHEVNMPSVLPSAYEDFTRNYDTSNSLSGDYWVGK